jgi:negative regulator of sigma E activity
MNKIMHPIEPEELMAYLDGELTADRATATAAHLGECAECQSIVAGLQNVSQTLKTWEAEPSKSDMPQAIAAALAKNRPQPSCISPARRSWRGIFSRRWAMVAWAGGAAGILVVVISTVRFIGGDATSAFSSVVSQIQNSGSDRDHFTASLRTPAAPAATAAERKESDKPKILPYLQPDQQAEAWAPQNDRSALEHNSIARGPMTIRTAQLSLITKEFDKARANLEAILKRHRGYVGELKAGGAAGSGRTLTATLRVPADQLDATLTEVKALGRVESESQSGQDVTSQYVDLQARLANARNTEQRLTDLLRNRTGKLSDVLEVEQELDRVRGEIEQMEAERKTMTNQVSFATLNATITEDYQAQLQVVPPSTSTRLSNAAVEGYRGMADGVVTLVLFLLSIGPSLLLWGAILFVPARLVWKKVRRSFAS